MVGSRRPRPGRNARGRVGRTRTAVGPRPSPRVQTSSRKGLAVILFGSLPPLRLPSLSRPGWLAWSWSRRVHIRADVDLEPVVLAGGLHIGAFLFAAYEVVRMRRGGG